MNDNPISSNVTQIPDKHTVLNEITQMIMIFVDAHTLTNIAKLFKTSALTWQLGGRYKGRSARVCHYEIMNDNLISLNVTQIWRARNTGIFEAACNLINSPDWCVVGVHFTRKQNKNEKSFQERNASIWHIAYCFFVHFRHAAPKSFSKISCF